TLRNGLPLSITEWRNEDVIRPRPSSIGIYAQDQWTVKNLTLNLGVRYDRMHGRVLGEHLDPIPLLGVGALDAPEVDKVPLWNDVTPRLGAAYDIFGNGKTAIKGSFGKYVIGETDGLSRGNGATNRIATSVTRTWNDSTFPVGDLRRANFLPDC